MDTTNLTPKKMKKGKNGKRGTRYYDTTGALVAKTCSNCDQVFPTAEFSPARQASDGLFSTCRTCTSKIQKEYRTRETVDITKYQKAYRGRTDEEIQRTIEEEYPSGVKTCPQCGVTKPLDMFYQNKSYPTGVSPSCKECSIRQAKDRQKRAAEDDPDYYRRNSQKARSAYLNRTDEQIRLVQVNRYPDGLKICPHCQEEKPVTSWGKYRGTPDGLIRYCPSCDNEKKRLRKKKTYESYWKSHNIPIECYVCGGPYEQSDHVIPEVLGGPDDPTNRLPMCAYHNGSKNGTPLRTWLSMKHYDTMDEILHKVTQAYNMRIEP